jgi:hypothetical protein
MDVTLNAAEIAEIDKQDPRTKGDGGFQSLMVRLQTRIDRTTGLIRLTASDLRRSPMYAFKYKQGGWEDRLKKAFGRTLRADPGRPAT